MREIGHGLYELETGDSLGGSVEAVTNSERARLTEAHSEHPWWADVVFFIHDMMAFGALVRQTVDEGVANAIIETTTTTGLKLLEHLTGSTDKAGELWMTILLEANQLDGVLQQHIRKENGIPNEG